MKTSSTFLYLDCSLSNNVYKLKWPAGCTYSQNMKRVNKHLSFLFWLIIIQIKWIIQTLVRTSLYSPLNLSPNLYRLSIEPNSYETAAIVGFHTRPKKLNRSNLRNKNYVSKDSLILKIFLTWSDTKKYIICIHIRSDYKTVPTPKSFSWIIKIEMITN